MSRSARAWAVASVAPSASWSGWFAGADGVVVCDASGAAAGRGAYVCADAAAWSAR